MDRHFDIEGPSKLLLCRSWEHLKKSKTQEHDDLRE
ncbi:hypothetical protein RIB2604_00101420 [Aspergillus luchuensis]|uniref:Uncharacterized protein n=1 Tax=Aspergillus kawachii TaxID=1069201 RepID=A0A146EX88_ASPKA|nr:hypothetical protein RIB2604_00101420 [Aspergillus luchuensis]